MDAPRAKPGWRVEPAARAPPAWWPAGAHVSFGYRYGRPFTEDEVHAVRRRLAAHRAARLHAPRAVRCTGHWDAWQEHAAAAAMQPPPGSWKDSSTVLADTPTHLVAQCPDMAGIPVKNTLVPAPGGVAYSNRNGVMWPDALPRSVAGSEWRIPAAVFQTHKSQKHVQDTPSLRAAQRSWQRWDGFAYHFFDNHAQDAFMAEHFPALYPLYAALPLPVMKADIWRYAVLYVRGGIYADADTVCQASPRPWIRSPTLLSVLPEPTHNFMCQWVMAAPARSPLLRAVLIHIENTLRALGPVRPQHFRDDPNLIHNTTGPAAFTDALQAWLREHHLPTLPHVTDYKRYDARVLRLHPLHFHTSHVVHLYHGDRGWKAEKRSFAQGA